MSQPRAATETPEQRYAEVMRRLNAHAGVGASVITLLIMFSAFGRWRTMALIVAIQVALVLFNLWVTFVGIKRFGARRAEVLRTVPNLAASLLIGYLVHWTLPAWLWLPFVAVTFESTGARSSAAITVASFCLAFDTTALCDGCAIGYPIVFNLLALYCYVMSQGRHDVIGAMLLESDAQRATLKETLANLQESRVKLADASRKAGAAQVATSVLHNVGNVLNSVNVSATLVFDAVKGSKLAALAKVSELIDGERERLGRFFTEDPRGRQLPDYLAALADAAQRERERILGELDLLRKHVDHVKVIVGLQQSHARHGGAIEELSLNELLDDALSFTSSSYQKHEIEATRDFGELPRVLIDRHKVFQIVMNLLSNARDALIDQPAGQRRVSVRTRRLDETRLVVEVEDAGVGIAPESLTKIFSLGFTTKKNGHGFGLHSSACTAAELGGSLTAASEGPGRGACFTLVVPTAPPSAARAA